MGASALEQRPVVVSALRARECEALQLRNGHPESRLERRSRARHRHVRGARQRDGPGLSILVRRDLPPRVESRCGRRQPVESPDFRVGPVCGIGQAPGAWRAPLRVRWSSAVRGLARRLAREIVDGSLEPPVGARKIWWDVLERVPSLLSSIGVFEALASEWEYTNRYKAEYEQDILEAAYRLLGEPVDGRAELFPGAAGKGQRPASMPSSEPQLLTWGLSAQGPEQTLCVPPYQVTSRLM